MKYKNQFTVLLVFTAILIMWCGPLMGAVSAHLEKEVCSSLDQENSKSGTNENSIGGCADYLVTAKVPWNSNQVSPLDSAPFPVNGKIFQGSLFSRIIQPASRFIVPPPTSLFLQSVQFQI